MKRYQFGVESFVPNATVTFGRSGWGFYACFRIAPSHALRVAHGLGWTSMFKVWNCTRHPQKTPQWMRDRGMHRP